MKEFLDENFLLETNTAQELFHSFAKDQPIIDFHCHLPVENLAVNRVFANITEAWLEGDHYKWRAMRTFGIDEKFVTGNASAKEKFRKWAQTVPFTVRNPLYHWTHLELQRYFDNKTLLSPDTADSIYHLTTEALTDGKSGCMDLVRKMNVQVICTTDDPTDDLVFHEAIAHQSVDVKVFPTFRPDKAFAIKDPVAYSAYIASLSQAVGQSIESYDQLIDALINRIEYFNERGCRLSDHGLEQLYQIGHHYSADAIFRKVMKGEFPSEGEEAFFQQVTLVELCRKYHKLGWTQQFHLGALRNNNSRMMRELGPDTGFDSIGDFRQATGISRFLDQLDSDNQLARTIIYNLNPSDNELIATMIGNFNDGSIAGKVQFGSGWWFLDQKDGMERQLNALSNMGLISQFVGMLTDSRSFLSYPRHEYFRRILCNLFGKDIENGELPHDLKLIGGIISDICYHNARKYFEFDKSSQKTSVL
ncbi:MAG: glucuronate isomerase [Bacteroidota bacterium]